MTLRAQPPRVAAPTPTPELAAAAGLIPAPYAPNHGAPAAPNYGAVPASSPAMLAAGVQAAPVAPVVPIAPTPGSPPVSPLQAGVGNTLRSEQAQSLDVACPRCHERNPVESRFCHACGYSVGAAAAPSAGPEPVAPVAAPVAVLAPAGPPICARCRGTNDPGSDFCKFCGARLSVAAAPQQAPLEPTDPHAVVPGFPNLSPALANGPIPMRTAMVVETRAGQVSNQSPAPAPQAAAPSPSNPAMPAVRPTAPPQAFDSQDARPQEHGVTRPHQGIGEIVRAHIVRIAKDGSEGVHHPITADVTDVGRTEGQILLPDDPYLSPRHARIVARPSPAIGSRATLTVIDLGSVNGVFVRLRAPHTLVHGDLLLLGQQVLRFEAVTEIEGARGPAMQHGVLLFGSPAPVTRARVAQRTVEGLVRDVLYVVREELVFGRENGDRTFPDDVFMSRRHAAIRRDANGYVLHDLGSSNGTFVQVSGEHPLMDGDQFRIGHHLFRVDVPMATAPNPGDPGAAPRGIA